MRARIRPVAIAVALLSVAGVTVRSAAAEAIDPCCGCVELSGAGQASLPAFFCGFFPGPAQMEAAAVRCEAFNATTSDPGLVCLNATAGDCRAALAARDIRCPASGAPAASTGALSALIALLGAVGYVAARRRARLPRV